MTADALAHSIAASGLSIATRTNDAATKGLFYNSTQLTRTANIANFREANFQFYHFSASC
jgi:hypothetical protein